MPTVGIRIDELELALLEWLRNYIDKYELTDALPEDVENVAAKEAIVKNFEKEHETLLKQRESLFDFLEQVSIRRKFLSSGQNALERRVKECMEHIISAQNDLHATLALQANRKKFSFRAVRICSANGVDLQFPKRTAL